MGLKKGYKRSVVLILMLILVIQSMSFADITTPISGGGFEVSGIQKGSESISEGDVFIYELTVKATEEIDNVEVYVSGDFSLASGASIDIGTLLNGDSETVSIPVKYSGSGRKLTLLIDNGAGNSVVINDTILKVIETSTPSIGEPDKDQYYPEFDLILGQSAPVFTAGVKQEFKFKLENKTSYYGKDVYVKFLNDENKAPFDLSVNPIKSESLNLNGKETKEFKMDILALGNAKSGYYTIPVEITSKNVYGLSQTKTKNIQVEIKNSKKVPSLVLSSVKIQDEILRPGKNQQVVFGFKNIGDLEAKNIKVTLESLELDKLMLNQDTKVKSINSISAGGTSVVIYNVTTSESVDTSKLLADLKLSFQDAYGGTYDGNIQSYLQVAVPDAADLYELKVNITKQPSVIKPGDHFTVDFDVVNNSKIKWEKLDLSLKAEGGFINKSQPIIKIDEIKPGQKKSYTYQMIAPENMTTNNYPAYITLKDSHDNVSEKYLGFFVNGEEQTSSKPKIIIEDYDFGSEYILAGDSFDLEITFRNTSQVMAIQNAKVSIQSEAGAFTPVDASSSFFISRISAGESVTHTITLKSKSDLTIQTFNIAASIEYEDGNGNSYDKNNVAYKADENMSIPVMQELRLEIEELFLSPFGYVYEPTELSVEFFNMGKAPLSNMLISSEGDFEFQDSKLFVGNFGPGSNDYYSCVLMPLNIGENKGKVIFEFEDALGEKHKIEKEFVMNAEEMIYTEGDFDGEYPENPGEFGEEEDAGTPWVKYGIIAGSILLAVVVVAVVLKKRKNKKEMAFDE